MTNHVGYAIACSGMYTCVTRIGIMIRASSLSPAPRGSRWLLAGGWLLVQPGVVVHADLVAVLHTLLHKVDQLLRRLRSAPAAELFVQNT